MMYYGEQAASNRTLHKPIEGEDPHQVFIVYISYVAMNALYTYNILMHETIIQMGGDFIITKNHKMALMYCSKTPPDRPSYNLLITSLKAQS